MLNSNQSEGQWHVHYWGDLWTLDVVFFYMMFKDEVETHSLWTFVTSPCLEALCLRHGKSEMCPIWDEKCRRGVPISGGGENWCSGHGKVCQLWSTSKILYFNTPSVLALAGTCCYIVYKGAHMLPFSCLHLVLLTGASWWLWRPHCLD